MSQRRPSALDSVLGRVDDLDASNLAILVRRLARERHLLETVFNTIREGILVLEASGRIDYANAAAAKLLGFPLKEVGRASLWKLVPDLARTLSIDGEGRLDELAGVSRELRLSYPESRYIRVYLVPLEEIEAPQGTLHEAVPTEESQHFAVIVSDITREKELSHEEMESARVRSIILLAAGVAHELGNPLNSLNIRLQLLERQVTKIRKTETREKMAEGLDICRREVARLDGIISHFLEAIRPQQPNLTEQNLLSILEETLEFLASELAGAGLQIDLELPSEMPLVLADGDQIKQLFFNVFKNAREATADGGSIRVRATVDDEFVFIHIADTGHGIPEEELAHVFEPYFTTKDGGHGLGMMIAERIMRDHGGQIGIDSREGVGTVVTLQFPQKHRRVRLLGEG